MPVRMPAAIAFDGVDLFFDRAPVGVAEHSREVVDSPDRFGKVILCVRGVRRHGQREHDADDAKRETSRKPCVQMK